MHVYKLVNLCTCVCRSYTSGRGQNEVGEGEKEGEERDREGEERRGRDREMEIKRGLEVGCRGGGEEGKRGEEKRSEEEENTWIYFKTRLYTPESGPFRK